jgi:hypothetical protein
MISSGNKAKTQFLIERMIRSIHPSINSYILQGVQVDILAKATDLLIIIVGLSATAIGAILARRTIVVTSGLSATTIALIVITFA